MPRLRFSAPLSGALFACCAVVASVGGAAAFARVAEPWLDPQSLSLFFVVPVVLISIAYGFGASLAAALLSTLAINFLFVTPRYSLTVTREQDFAALILFALVGAMVSVIAAQARAAEQARLSAARERIKTDLLASVSHDLRTPLATIVFTLQSLQRFAADHTSEARDELLSLAEREARRLASLVDTLLDASRIEARATPVHLQEASIADIANIALKEARSVGRAAAVSKDIPEGLPSVRVDPVLSVRALANVLSNALLHASGSPIELEARQSGNSIVLTVSDCGPGLGADPERLFGKFQRGLEGDGRAPGLGLGLSLARGFLESQGGSISAQTRPEGGALFELRFPIAVTADGD